MKKILIALCFIYLFTSCCHDRPYCEDVGINRAYKEGDTINFHKLDTKEYSSLPVDTVFIVTKSIRYQNTVGKCKVGDYCENVFEFTISSLSSTSTENLVYYIVLRSREEKLPGGSEGILLSEIKTNNDFILKELDYSDADGVIVDSVIYYFESSYTEHTNIDKGYTIDTVLFNTGLTHFGFFGFHVKDNNSWYYVK